jgi:hypothetical protein
MHINKTIETPEGGVSFDGYLEQEELDLIIKIGLNYLLQQGALPLITRDAVMSQVNEQ